MSTPFKSGHGETENKDEKLHNNETEKVQIGSTRRTTSRFSRIMSSRRTPSSSAPTQQVVHSQQVIVQPVIQNGYNPRTTFIKIGVFVIAIILLITFVYMYSTDDVDYIDFAPYANRAYSKNVIQGLVDRKVEYDTAVKEVGSAVQDYLVDETTTVAIPEVEAGKRKISASFDEDFREINQYLYDYCTQYGSYSLTFRGSSFDFDGLFYMFTCNTESGFWTMNTSKTISGAFPSKFVDITVDEDSDYYYKKIIEKCNLLVVLDAIRGRLTGSGFVDQMQPWVKDLGTQGPSTQAFPSTFTNLGTNEYDTVSPHKDALSKMYNTHYIDTILSSCTGSSATFSGYGTVAATGDRWRLKDELTVFKTTQASTLNGIEAVYPPGMTPSMYELVMWSRFTHWLPSYLTFDKSGWETYGSGNYYKDYQAWFAYMHVLSTEKIVNAVREQVRKDIANGSCNYVFKDITWNRSIYEMALAENFTWTTSAYPGETYKLNSSQFSSVSAWEYPVKWLYGYIALEEAFNG